MGTIKERVAARVLLISPEGRLLLLRAEGGPVAGPSAFWFTVGGGLELNEDLTSAARREVAEETGLSNVRFGPAVAFRAGADLLR